MPYILIVDDMTEFRHAIAELLQFEGFEVVEADNPANGFDQLALRRPDLILVDLSFPHFDGVNFIHWVRHNRLCADTPIIVVSGFSDAAHIEKAMASGANDYLVKPFAVAKMLERIQRLIAPIPPM